MNSDARKYLIFSLSGGLYAFQLSQVAEVCEPQPFWPIPAAPPCYCGAMNFHGSIVAVMDLAAFMGLPEQNEAEKLIVLHGDIAALAFLVERVIRIVSANQVKMVDTTGEPFANGLVVLPEGQATLLDAQAITDHAAGSINTPM
jgi:purine-binding chemotaxis protein CheW